MFFISNISSVSFASIVFSIGSDSPENDDWLINKSFASSNLRSAGIKVPALSFTISPKTMFSALIIVSLLSLITIAVEYIFVSSVLLNLYTE